MYRQPTKYTQQKSIYTRHSILSRRRRRRRRIHIHNQIYTIISIYDVHHYDTLDANLISDFDTSARARTSNMTPRTNRTKIYKLNDGVFGCSSAHDGCLYVRHPFRCTIITKIRTYNIGKCVHSYVEIVHIYSILCKYSRYNIPTLYVPTSITWTSWAISSLGWKYEFICKRYFHSFVLRVYRLVYRCDFNRRRLAVTTTTTLSHLHPSAIRFWCLNVFVNAAKNKPLLKHNLKGKFMINWIYDEMKGKNCCE